MGESATFLKMQETSLCRIETKTYLVCRSFLCVFSTKIKVQKVSLHACMERIAAVPFDTGNSRLFGEIGSGVRFLLRVPLGILLNTDIRGANHFINITT